jgi:hypothetical protein
VRQELLSAVKPYLQSAYRTYHGMADLYVYFYELGMRLLKPGGLLSYVVTNKWMKASYAEPLRRFFAENAWIESVVDFGHAKQIFEEVDVFPSIIVARRPTEAPKPNTARLCTIPREQLHIDDLSQQIEHEGVELPLSQLGADAWQLEPGGVNALLAKIRANGVPLNEYTGSGRYRGVTTGLNDAFLISNETKEGIIRCDANSAAIIKPCLRGQDIMRWTPDFADQWLIFARRGIDIDAYPGVKNYLSKFRKELEPRPADWKGDEWPGRKPGRYEWYELQDPIDFFEEFSKPKIYYQEIQYHPAYAYDPNGLFGNNKTSFIVSGDLFLLGVLNSPLMWWHNWRYLPHMKDEALAPTGYLVVDLPVANARDEVRRPTEMAVARLVEIARNERATRLQILDWLRVEYEVEKPTLKLQSPFDLDCDAFVAEVKKVRGKKRTLTAAALANLRDEYARTIQPARALAAEALNLENEVSKLVNEAYGLTPEEVALMWQTAPPRIPISDPRLPRA